jgi:hypothetical protein
MRIPILFIMMHILYVSISLTHQCATSNVFYSSLQYRGGPELSAESCCIDCVIDYAKSITSASCFKNERMKIRRILEDGGSSSKLIGEFYVSKTWYDL